MITKKIRKRKSIHEFMEVLYEEKACDIESYATLITANRKANIL